MVLMVFAPELGVEGVLPRVAAGRLAPTARPAPAIKRWRRDMLALGLNGSFMGHPLGVSLVSVTGEQVVSHAWAKGTVGQAFTVSAAQRANFAGGAGASTLSFRFTASRGGDTSPGRRSRPRRSSGKITAPVPGLGGPGSQPSARPRSRMAILPRGRFGVGP